MRQNFLHSALRELHWDTFRVALGYPACDTGIPSVHPYKSNKNAVRYT